MFVVAWHLEAEQMCQFTKEEFMRFEKLGYESFQCILYGCGLFVCVLMLLAAGSCLVLVSIQAHLFRADSIPKIKQLVPKFREELETHFKDIYRFAFTFAKEEPECKILGLFSLSPILGC